MTRRRHRGFTVVVGLLTNCVCVCGFDLFKYSLTSFRWIVPANGEITLRVWFYRDSPGKFEQTFNFELLGTRRNYQLQCTGICSYPSICTDYMLVRTACLHSVSLPCDAGVRKADGGLEVMFYLRSSPTNSHNVPSDNGYSSRSTVYLVPKIVAH